MPVEDRLALSQSGRREALERARQEREQEALADCTFVPQVGRDGGERRLVGVMPGPWPCKPQRLACLAEQQHHAANMLLSAQTLAFVSPPLAQLVTQPERHLQREYTPLHRRLGEEQKRRSAKLAQARMQQVRFLANRREEVEGLPVGAMQRMSGSLLHVGVAVLCT